MNLTKSSGLSNDRGNRNLMMLQESVKKRELVTYRLCPRRGYPECVRLRPVKNYMMRKIRTAFGTVEIKNARWILCRRCLPRTCMTFTVLNEICPDQARPELIDRGHRALGEHGAVSQSDGDYRANSACLSPPKAM